MCAVLPNQSGRRRRTQSRVAGMASVSRVSLSPCEIARRRALALTLPMVLLGATSCSNASSAGESAGVASERPSSSQALPSGSASTTSMVDSANAAPTAFDSESATTTIVGPASAPMTMGSGELVRGKVIDFWGHPLASVTVGIGEQQTQTDEDGTFTIPNVGPTYDAELVVRLMGELVEVYGWRYEGLTRRDPTLQVYKGLRQREAQVKFAVKGIDEGTFYAEAAIGGIDGHRAYPVTSVTQSLAAWRGSPSIEAPVHVLSWDKPEVARIPQTYRSHTHQKVTLTDQGVAHVALDLTFNGTLPVANISGSVHTARARDWVQLVFARFDEGPSISLVSELVTQSLEATFVYPAPVIDGMSLTVAARENVNVARAGYSTAYVSGVGPGEDVGTLELPEPPDLQAPAEGATDVTTATVFQWQTDGGTSVIVFEDMQVFQAVYVVTSATFATLPDLSRLGLFHSDGGAYTWAVEVHGTSTTTDELASEQGFLDPFSGDLNYPMGLHRGKGRFGRSTTRTFTTGKVSDSAFAR